MILTLGALVYLTKIIYQVNKYLKVIHEYVLSSNELSKEGKVYFFVEKDNEPLKLSLFSRTRHLDEWIIWYESRWYIKLFLWLRRMIT